jgi:transcriptional regulator with XRE-family HTH domain
MKMLKLPLYAISPLGTALQRERKARQLSQSDLAQQALISIPTIHLLENGQGNLTSFWTVLHTLNLDIVGRNLPPGESIGERIIALRHRRGVSQRELIKLVGVSQPTIIELEHHCTGRLNTLDRVLVALGAGAYLAPIGSTQAFYVHAGNSSVSETGTTPKELLEPLYSVFGTFDLDPCSPTSNGRTAPVRAKVHYTQDDDGLSLPWFGRVFCNPPYGRSLGHWVAKAYEESRCGNTQTIVMLIPARTDTKFWHQSIIGKAAIFFLKGRLKFGNADQVAPFPSCLVVWGASEDLVNIIQAALPESWLSR